VIDVAGDVRGGNLFVEFQTALAAPALYLSIQLRKRNSSIGICGKLRVTTQRFGNSLIFVGQNVGKRFEKIRDESCYSFSGKGEREFLYVNQCSHVRRTPLSSPLEQRLSGYGGGR
jgi:hypothetical protein